MAKKLKLVAEGLGRRFAAVKKARDYDLVYILREAALLGPPCLNGWSQDRRADRVRLRRRDLRFVSQSVERVSQLFEVCRKDEDDLSPRVARDGGQSVSRRLRAPV
jgi:hypothetical protein